MLVNKHAIFKYRALDKCFSNFVRRFYIADLIQVCNDVLYLHTGGEKHEVMRPSSEIASDIRTSEKSIQLLLSQLFD